MESISEMRFSLVNNKAEFGEVTNVTAITKSGQNQIHGRLFEQNSTSVLNARQFFAAARGQNIINDFGGSIEGRSSGTKRSSSERSKDSGSAFPPI